MVDHRKFLTCHGLSPAGVSVLNGVAVGVSSADEGRVLVRTIAGAVVAVGGEILLVRRAVPEGALVWQFPAGKGH
jgi:hypothetical protein